MTTKTKAARRSCNYDTRQNVHLAEDNTILHDFQFGSLVAGIIIAVSFGLLFIHAAVML